MIEAACNELFHAVCRLADSLSDGPEMHDLRLLRRHVTVQMLKEEIVRTAIMFWNRQYVNGDGDNVTPRDFSPLEE
jgi:hypothetical protein